MQLDDATLLALIQSPATYEKGCRLLVSSYQARLYALIRKMVLLHEDADDVLQETFLKAWRNIGRFEGQSSLYTWLYRIAVNESLNFLEKKKRRLLFFSSNHEEEMARYVQHASEFDGDEVERRLQRALLTLPDKQRLVFQLRYYDDLSYEAIAEITGTSVGSLKASYHHAVKKIEVSVKEE